MPEVRSVAGRSRHERVAKVLSHEEPSVGVTVRLSAPRRPESSYIVAEA
jgi:hypothetical protein